jgi:hypothetical protein
MEPYVIITNIVIITYLYGYKKKKVGLDKLAKFQMTAAYSVQTRPVLDNFDALQYEQCQRWQHRMQYW